MRTKRQKFESDTNTISTRPDGENNQYYTIDDAWHFTPDTAWEQGTPWQLTPVPAVESSIGNVFETEELVLASNMIAGTAEGLSNPLSTNQWYLSHTMAPPSAPSENVTNAWATATGAGIRIGIVDSGFDLTHLDLANRFNGALSYDPRDATGQTSINPDSAQTDKHGTWVAGVIGADGTNNYGIVGIAYGAELLGSYIRFGAQASSRSEIATILERQQLADVANASWGFRSQFADNFTESRWSEVKTAIQEVATEGRGGLGTSWVFAAGNDRQYIAGSAVYDGDNTNYHSLTNARQIITVAASDSLGNVAAFSTPGASILVSAPGVDIFTTSTTGGGEAFESVSGTSFAAPIVSGVIALMLQANPDLGYRDIQEILSATASRPGAVQNWSENGATNWNGGGALVNSDLGFGIVDASAAVRLAQTWTRTSTAANEASVSLQPVGLSSRTFSDGGSAVLAFNVPQGQTGLGIEWLEIDVVITHAHVGDLTLTVTSPSGMISTLVDRPGAGNNTRDNLSMTLTSAQFRNEDASGEWTIRITDAQGNGGGTLQVGGFRLFGQAAGTDTVHVFTNDVAGLTDRAQLIDRDGANTLNMSAMTLANTINLDQDTATIGGRAFTIDSQSVFSTIYGGEAADVVTASQAQDSLMLSGRGGGDNLAAGAGNDTVDGGDGNDFLTGGQGNDDITGGAGFDYANYLVRGTLTGVTVDLSNEQAQATGGAGVDRLTGIEGVFGSNLGDRLTGNDAAVNALYGWGGNDELNGGGGFDYIEAGDGDDTMDGGAGDDYLIGNAGTDTVTYARSAAGVYVDLSAVSGAGFGAGTDVGFDILSSVERVIGSSHEDFLFGSNSADTILGNQGTDVLLGAGGDDVLDGGAGGDYIVGGAGRDIITTGGGQDFIYISTAFDGCDTITDWRQDGFDMLVVDSRTFGQSLASGSFLNEAGNQGRFVSGAATGQQGQFVWNGTTSTLSWDADGAGSGVAVAVATLTGVTTLQASDILVL
jgi:subtilisin family serine protease